MSVRIIVDDDAIKAVERRLGEFSHKAPNAISNALNRSVSNISSNISKEVRKDYHIKTADVKETLNIFKANRSKLSAEVKSRGGTIGLDKFKVGPKTVNPKRKSQLKIAVKKNGVKQILGAFIANLNGTKVFTRDTKKRLPISRKFGPSVPQMLGNEATVERINQQAHETYENRLNHEINRILTRI